MTRRAAVRSAASLAWTLCRGFAVISLIALALFLGGCGEENAAEPAGIRLTGQAIQTGALGGGLERGIRVMVYGRDADGPSPNLPFPKARVAFTLVQQPEGARGAAVTSPETTTNAAGAAFTGFVLGDKPGIYRVRVGLPDHPDIAPATVTILGGVHIIGQNQDGWVGKALDRPLIVRMERAPGEFIGPDDGLVRFTLMSAPDGTALSGTVVRSDADGDASTYVRLGGTQGRVDVGVTILNGIPGDTALLAPIRVQFFSIDIWAVTAALLGGVGLFLFGMRLMSESLQFVAGDKLRSLLNLLTRNRFLAVGAGAVVTALIQSSTACSVMVVGFANAGLMRLEQAIGVIMGANVGTTITAQIISLKLSAVALPAVCVGVFILFLAKRQTTKYWASILIGFGILFLGMNIMSGELGQLRESESVVSLFSGLNSTPGADGFVPLFPFLKALGLGFLVTVVLQSSAATIGMLITVASAGLIDPYAAFGVLLGDNLGTTLTAVLASVGTNTAAKRTAAFHVSFNVVGCTIMILLNYVNWPGKPGRPVFMELVNTFTAGDVFVGGENLPRFIANSHTLFNVTCSLLFIGFIPLFARLCRWVVPDDPKEAGEREDARRILEPHLLATPSLALQQVWNEVGVMLGKAREAQNEGYRALISDPSQDWSAPAREARSLERETDELKNAITKYLSNISLSSMNEAQSEMFPHLVRTVNDAERVADMGKHLSKLAKRVNKRSLVLSPQAVEDMNAMMAMVNKMIELAEKTVNINADGIETSGGGAVLRAKLLEDGVRMGREAKAMATLLRKNHERRHEEGVCDIKAGVVFLDVANSLARSAGCALNIIQAACHAPEKKGAPPTRRISVRWHRSPGRE